MRLQVDMIRGFALVTLLLVCCLPSLEQRTAVSCRDGTIYIDIPAGTPKSAARQCPCRIVEDVLEPEPFRCSWICINRVENLAF